MFGVYFEVCGSYLQDELYRNFKNRLDAIRYAQEITTNDLTEEETYVVIDEEIRRVVYTAD